VLRPTNSAGDARLYLCVTRSSASQRSEKFFLVTVPESYPFSDEVRHGEPFRVEGNSLVLSAGTGSDAVASCEVPRGEELVAQVPILTATPGEPVLLPGGTPNAVIVSYSDGRDGLGLGYIAAAPFFGGYRRVSLDLTQSALYTERDGAKPYLLLLTPLTAAADAAAVPLVGFAAAAVAIQITVHCWNVPECH
jgi:hypothetical protein